LHYDTLGAKVVSVALLILPGLFGQQTADQVFDQAVRLQQAGKWAEAEQAYRAHLKRFGAKPETLANLGAVLVQQERFQEAIGAYTHALKLAPGVLPIRLNLGLAYFKSGQLAPAVEQFTAILEQQPGNQQVRQLRAMCLLELERYEEAARDYSALMPSQDVDVSLGLASAYMRLDRTPEALRIMEPLFGMDSAEVKLLLGYVLDQSGRLEEAKAALERAAQLDPSLPMVHLHLGAMYWRQQETEAAIAEWRKELSAHPESFQANYTLGTALAVSEDAVAASKRIEEASRLLRKAVALSDDGQAQAGMGLGIGDFNLDGNLDISKTHFAEDTSGLYLNRGKGGFEDVTIASGLGVETRFVTFGAGMADLDNDGLPDLFAVTGSVYPEVEKKLRDFPHHTPRYVFRNLGGDKFEELIAEAGPGVAASHASRGCAFGDFDNDGDLDILILNQNEPPWLLRNDVSGGYHWLKVKLLGVKSNRSAIGARITARYGGRLQAQEVLAQSSYLSVNDSRLHFGLGKAESADLEVRWPNGATEVIKGIAADRLVVIREGAGIVKTDTFRRG
jgi:tetratricopeptide (TPR) repeat protein